MCLGIYGLTRSVLAFCNNGTLKNKNKTYLQFYLLAVAFSKLQLLYQFGINGLNSNSRTGKKDWSGLSDQIHSLLKFLKE